MTNTPKDGDLGLTAHPLFVRYNGSEWMHPNGRDADVVTPTGERAIPIDVCEQVARFLRSGDNSAPENLWYFQMADILDPPTPIPEPDEKAKLLERVRNLERENLAYYKKLGYELTPEDIAQLTRTPLPEGDA